MSNSRKLLAYAIIILVIGVSIIPVMGDIGATNYRDDTTPPVTTCTLNPPEPNGLNGWYNSSDVEVTLNATDDMSGVNATYYRLNEEEWETYDEPFVIESDGCYVIEYYSVDNAGNVEDVKSADFKIDQTPPTIDFTWMSFYVNGTWVIEFRATCSDATSGVDRVEFYLNDGLMFTDNVAPYMWILHYQDWHRAFKAVVFDNAGNSAFATIKSSDIDSYSTIENLVSVNNERAQMLVMIIFYMSVAVERGITAGL